MNLDNVKESTFPFKHWEISNCLNIATLDEIIGASIPMGNRAYDGTRAADATGGGLDGKLRLFVTNENSKFFPHLTVLIKYLQDKKVHQKIKYLLAKTSSSPTIFPCYGVDILLFRACYCPTNFKKDFPHSIGKK